MLKNITLTAEAALIEKARRRAAHEHKTLNQLFRAWIGRYAGENSDVKTYKQMMARLKHIKAGGPFTRNELNER